MALNTVDTGYQIPTGGSPVTINAHGVCKIVRNNRAQAVFVPTKLAAQWTSFINNPLPSMTVTNCCSSFTYSGYCYRMGGAGASCTSACSGAGGCNATGTNFIGNGGTLARCKAVMDGLGLAPVGADPIDSSSTDPSVYVLGCAGWDGGAYGLYRLRYIGGAATCAGASASIQRICSCNN